MSRALFLLVLMLLSQPSRACLMFLDEKPSVATPPRVVDALQQREGREVWEMRAAERQQIADKQWDFRSQNNLSVALAHLGRLDEALERMQTVERTYPGQRETAANLGTVYELKGDLAKSKFWIAEGIRRELKTTGKNRLDGTEWLHLRILDAKMNVNEPTASVSGVDFGDSRVPQAPTALPKGNGGATLTLAQVQSALQEQLHERLEFVQAPDPVVGELLFDFANSVAVAGNSDDARDLYKMALEFKPLSANLAQNRFDYFAGTPNYALQGVLWSLGLGAVAFYFGRKKWLEQREWRAMPVQNVDEVAPAKPTAYIDCSRYNPFDRD